MKAILTKLEFIRVWNESKSIDEFCKTTGYAYMSASSRASHFRASGCDIKTFADHKRAGALGAAVRKKGGKT